MIRVLAVACALLLAPVLRAESSAELAALQSSLVSRVQRLLMETASFDPSRRVIVTVNKNEYEALSKDIGRYIELIEKSNLERKDAAGVDRLKALRKPVDAIALEAAASGAIPSDAKLFLSGAVAAVISQGQTVGREDARERGTPPPKEDVKPGDPVDAAARNNAPPAGWSPGGGAAANGPNEPEATEAAARADASVERARGAGSAAGKAVGGAQAWKDGREAGAGGIPGGGGRDGSGGAARGGGGPAPKGAGAADPELARARQGGYKDSLASLGYKLGPGSSIVHRDGRPASDEDLKILARDLRAEPRALERRPDFFSVVPREQFNGLKASYPDRAASPEFKHIGMTSDRGDFKWKQSCSRVSGDCNEHAATESYKRDDFVDPETLSSIARMMKELDAGQEKSDANSTAEPGEDPNLWRYQRRVSRSRAAEGGVSSAGEWGRAREYDFSGSTAPAAGRPGRAPVVGTGRYARPNRFTELLLMFLTGLAGLLYVVTRRR